MSDASTAPEDLIDLCDNCVACTYFSCASYDIALYDDVMHHCPTCDLDLCTQCVADGGHKRHRSKIKQKD